LFCRPGIILLFAALLLVAVAPLCAQQNNVPFDRDIHIDVERSAARRDSRMHTGLKPVLEGRMDLTDVKGYRVDTSKYYLWQTEKLFRDHLLEVRRDDVFLAADVLVDFHIGHDFGDATLYPDTVRYYQNTRGFRIRGDIGDKLSFETMVFENQAILPQYLFRQVQTHGVLSGQGRTKIEAFRKVDYGWSQGNVSWSPAFWANVQFGHGRHFVGHGYRSILLSDHAVSAPYLKMSFITRRKWLQYSTWHTKLQHGVLQSERLPTGTPGESLFYWMRARFNHLSLSFGRFDLGFFEGTIFRNLDENGVRPLDAMELNPVIGWNTLRHGFKGEYKTLVGADMRVRITNKAFIYGQFGTDDPGPDRYSWQAGLRLFDIIRQDIHLQLEYNHADPFMYMHQNERMAWMHSGLPLAHPFGAHFDEIVGIADIGFGRVRWQNRVVLGTYNLDPDAGTNVGSNLRKPDLPVVPEEGPVVRHLTWWDSNVSYLFNPKTNLRALAGFTRRDLPGAADGAQSSFFYISLRTGLFNRYYDI
jgi:hypothetical protein